ncbi:MAG: hypothetical protein Q9212_002998 [Teloschistes hypoglaucus]
MAVIDLTMEQCLMGIMSWVLICLISTVVEMGIGQLMERLIDLTREQYLMRILSWSLIYLISTVDEMGATTSSKRSPAPCNFICALTHLSHKGPDPTPIGSYTSSTHLRLAAA